MAMHLLNHGGLQACGALHGKAGELAVDVILPYAQQIPQVAQHLIQPVGLSFPCPLRSNPAC